MVQKIVILILLSAQLAQAATPHLLLQWSGDKSPRCQKLVETFLTELRALASDRLIELDAIDTINMKSDSPGRFAIKISCEQNAIRVGSTEDSLLVRYSPKAAGFEAMDWLPFQHKYLRPDATPELADLAPQSVKNANEELNTPATQEVKADKTIFQRWWFWGIVAGAVGGGIYAITSSNSRSSSVNVEIQ